MLGPAEAEATCKSPAYSAHSELETNTICSLTVLRNKFSHTVTLFFLCTYNEQWPTFFSDIFALISPTEQHSRFNRHVSLLFFHIVLEISGEVADQIIKSARTFLATRHARDGRVRDGVRERDAARINEAVLAIVAEGAERMNELRKNSSMDPGPRDDLDHAIEVVDWGIRTFGSYVGMSFLVFSSLVVTLERNLQAGSISTLPSLLPPSLFYSLSSLIRHSQSD